MGTACKKDSHHNHDHDHGHGHNHDHGNLPVIMFFIGLVAFALGFVFESSSMLIANLFFAAAILTAGYHIIGEGFGDTFTDTRRRKKFTPNIHFLMTLATAGAVAIGNFEEGALLIVIFAAAHFLEEYADGKSKREITNLLKMNPTEARLILTNGSTKIVQVEEVKVGDILQVLNGDQIPTDGIIINGVTSVDESAINGESMPKEKSSGDEVFGSTINGSGSFTMEVTKDSKDTVFAKILQMVDQAQGSLTKTATLIKQLEPIYVTVVLVLLPLVILSGPYLFGWTWNLSLYRGLVFLISASPCALAASAVPTTLSTISNLAKRGVLVKGGAYLSKIVELKAISFDKTGTLTNGKPVVTNYDFSKNVDEAAILEVIVAMEKQSNHPLATAIINKFTNNTRLDITVENEIGKGLTARYNGINYRIGKPDSFTDVSTTFQNKQQAYASDGKTVVYVAQDDVVIGLIALMDVPNEQAQPAIAYFKEQGIHTTMITGDAVATGEAVGNQVGIDEVVANVMPEDKATIVKQQQERYGSTGMLGDGINDAPALVTADVGIAMGEGTDVAIDVADLVLMKNDLSKLVYAHRLAQKMNKVIWQNIFFSLFVVVTLVTLNFLGKTDIAIGIIFHEGSTLVVILNGLRLLLPPKQLK
ncbi:Cd2+/Zn2+-exporting ATPase [Amphibacillus marinus]|uniref:Cd2+/Zn2+-exporting ATPase n=1 Tax=Amphibacillus marinus TaxID=872970 RepID=A0A1H8KAI6_9BACI|nr:Cd2+/Zn2+-exporting ATPase [Amphibacillus marinus]